MTNEDLFFDNLAKGKIESGIVNVSKKWLDAVMLDSTAAAEKHTQSSVVEYGSAPSTIDGLLNLMESLMAREREQRERNAIDLPSVPKEVYEQFSNEEKNAYTEGRSISYQIQKYWGGCCGLETYNKYIKPYLDIVERFKTAEGGKP